MIKIKKLQYSLKVLFGKNKSNETAYTNTVVSEDGTYVYLTNPYDPNTQDVQIEYSQVVEPTSTSITDLVDILRCQVLEGLGRIYLYEDSVDVLGADCNALQNVANDLYQRGQLLSGGGGGSVITDGDTISGTGTLVDPLFTTLTTDKDSLKGVGSSSDPFYVENFNNYFQIEEHFMNGVTGTPISQTTPAGFTSTVLGGEGDHPGIIRLTAGTNGSGIINGSSTISVRLGGTSLATSPILLGNKHNKYEAVVRFNSFAISSGYNVNFRLGFMSDPFANVDGFFIGWDTDLFLGIPAGELRLVKQIAGVGTGYAPAIPFTFTAGQQYRISLDINNLTSEYSLNIDGITIMTNVTNPIGTFPTGLVSPSASIQHRTSIALATPHQLDIDYLKYKVEYPTKQKG